MSECIDIPIRAATREIEQFCFARAVPHLIVYARTKPTRSENGTASGIVPTPVNASNPDRLYLSIEDFIRHYAAIRAILKKYDFNVLIGIVRKAMPQIVAYDIVGVQPMQGPVAQIMTMRARYGEPDLTPKTWKYYWDRRRGYLRRAKLKLKWYLIAPGWYLRYWIQNYQRWRTNDHDETNPSDGSDLFECRSDLHRLIQRRATVR